MPQTKRDNRRFQRGAFASGSAAYVCGICRKKTRETGKGESDFSLCANCLARSENENAHNDYGHPSPVANCPECERAATR